MQHCCFEELVVKAGIYLSLDFKGFSLASFQFLCSSLLFWDTTYCKKWVELYHLYQLNIWLWFCNTFGSAISGSFPVEELRYNAYIFIQQDTAAFIRIVMILPRGSKAASKPFSVKYIWFDFFFLHLFSVSAFSVMVGVLEHKDN